MSATYERVGSLADIPPGGRLSIVLGDEVTALVLRVGDELYCVEDVCTHDGQPMTTGDFDGCELTCPRHGAKFDVKTGRATCMPATEPIQTFDVEVRNGEIFVQYSD